MTVSKTVKIKVAHCLCHIVSEQGESQISELYVQVLY